jgi:hypothetical protein
MQAELPASTRLPHWRCAGKPACTTDAACLCLLQTLCAWVAGMGPCLAASPLSPVRTSQPSMGGSVMSTHCSSAMPTTATAPLSTMRAPVDTSRTIQGWDTWH